MNRASDSPGRLGAYPTGDGDITDVGRRQQIAVSVWVLGWLGGPLPALMALVVTRPAAGTYRRLLVAAAGFWAAVAVAAAMLVIGLRGDSGWLAPGWATLSVTCLAVTALAIRRALRGVR